MSGVGGAFALNPMMKTLAAGCAVAVALSAIVPLLDAQTVTWDRKAMGQQFTCPNGASGGYRWPDNIDWSQAQRFEATNQCGPPQTVEIEPSNWTTSNYPNSTTVDVVIPASQSVRLNLGVNVGTLSLGTGASLLMDRSSLTVANGAVTNNGTITAKNNLGAAILTFTKNATLSGSGDFVLFNNGASDAGARLATSAGVVLTQSAGHKIRGIGYIDANIINNGVISSDAAVNAGNLIGLAIGAFDITNNATMQAIDAHILELNDTRVAQASSGQVIANNGTISCNGAKITGGTLNAANGGIFSGGSVTLTNLTNNAPMNVGNYATNGAIVNNNTISVLGNPYHGALTAASNTTISGNGKITMTQGSYSFIDAVAGATLTQAAGHTIDGNGVITAPVINNGSILSNGSFGSLGLITANKTNNGLIKALGKNLYITAIAINQGSNGQIVADGAAIDLQSENNVLPEINGGTIASTNGGIVRGAMRLVNVKNNAEVSAAYASILGGGLVNNGSIAILGNPYQGTVQFTVDTTVSGTGSIYSTQGGYSLLYVDRGATLTNAAGHTISGNGYVQGAVINKGIVTADTAHGYGGYLTFQSSSTTSTSITNDGGMVIAPANGGLSFEVPLVQTLGTIDLQGGDIYAYSGIDLNGGQLVGNGTIHGNVRNNGGSMSPGHSPGKITVTGDYTQGANGTLTMEIGGSTAGTGYDQLAVSGTATLAGTLNVTAINGFKPSVGDVYTLISAGAFSGNFTTVNSPGFTGRIDSSSNGITFTVTSTSRELLNISTRMKVLTDENVLIGGFIVTGTEAKKVLVRGLGPSLPVAGQLADPTLRINQGQTVVATNDNWRDTQEQAIKDTTVPPTNDKESAIVVTLQPGNYTATLAGKSGGTGGGQVEVYDLSSTAASQLANISTRGYVDVDDNVMIGGVIVGGGSTGSTAKVLVRAIGPSLASQGVAGALQDPTLELRDGNGQLVAQNDNWKSSQEQAIRDTTIPPTDDRESAIVQTVPAGNYTAIVRGVNRTKGVGLVELYNLQ